MAGDEILIKKLDGPETDQVSRFSMVGEEDKPLQIFLRRSARKSADANLTQTYVAKLNGDPRVAAYISVMCAEVRLEGSYTLGDKAEADRFTYQPAVRIARLACCDAHQGNGLGRLLVETVIGMTLVSIMPHAGCRFLILDAKRKSISFYQKLGFRLLDTAANRQSTNPIMFLDLRDVATELET